MVNYVSTIRDRSLSSLSYDFGYSAIPLAGSILASNVRTPFSINVRYYPNAKGVGLNILKNGERLIGFDWHRFKLGGKKTGKFYNLPHLDIGDNISHWPWKQLDKWNRGVK